MALATQGANTSYSYDAIGRVTRVVIDNGGTNGLTTISYSYDLAGNRTAVVTTTGTNTAPTAVADAVSTAKNVPLTFDPRTNDTDTEGQYLTITGVGTPSSGTASINSSGLVVYSPATNFTGTATFTYTISDGSLTSTATDTVTVSGGPAANADSFYGRQDTAYTLSPLTNDSAPSGMTLSISAVGAPSHGWASIGSGGTTLIYTPATGYHGTDSFTYTVSDGHGGSATATVTAYVTQPPVAVADSIGVQPNGFRTYDTRVNDSDPQSYALTISAVSSAAHGAVVINSGASVTYTPTTGYTGTDSFTYTIDDGHGITATATVSVIVSATNNPPDAVDDSRLTQKNTVLVFDPRTNDTDADGNSLTVTAVSTPAHGTATFTGTQLTYTPTTGYTGADSFTYTISDGQGGSDTANVSVSVNGPPAPTTDTKTMAVNSVLNFNPLSNDTDPDGDTLTVTGKTDGAHGTVTYTGTSVTYTPTTSYVGSDSFTYTASDGRGGTASGTVNVTVSSNLAPVATDDSADANAYYAGGAWVFPSVTFDPRTNDTDPDSDTLTITAVTQPASGTVTFTGTQVIYTYGTHYHPTGVDSTLVDSDSFTYTISDGHGHTTTATVYINVIVW